MPSLGNTETQLITLHVQFFSCLQCFTNSYSPKKFVFVFSIESGEVTTHGVLSSPGCVSTATYFGRTSIFSGEITAREKRELDSSVKATN